MLHGAINDIIAQDQNTRFLTESEDLVRGYYLIIFLLMTLFIIFVATWLAFYLARGFVQPIEDLALATQRVSEGELGYQVELRGTLDKDFALLMQSFNSMSRDLLEHQIALDKTTNQSSGKSPHTGKSNSLCRACFGKHHNRRNVIGYERPH